jgi:hypothetical protein
MYLPNDKIELIAKLVDKKDPKKSHLRVVNYDPVREVCEASNGHVCVIVPVIPHPTDVPAQIPIEAFTTARKMQGKRTHTAVKMVTQPGRTEKDKPSVLISSDAESATYQCESGYYPSTEGVFPKYRRETKVFGIDAKYLAAVQEAWGVSALQVEVEIEDDTSTFTIHPALTEEWDKRRAILSAYRLK